MVFVGFAFVVFVLLHGLCVLLRIGWFVINYNIKRAV